MARRAGDAPGGAVAPRVQPLPPELLDVARIRRGPLGQIGDRRRGHVGERRPGHVHRQRKRAVVNRGVAGGTVRHALAVGVCAAPTVHSLGVGAGRHAIMSGPAHWQTCPPHIVPGQSGSFVHVARAVCPSSTSASMEAKSIFISHLPNR